MENQCIEDVPEEKVSVIVQEFVESSATKITAEKQPDGTWTIRADIPS